MQKITLGKLDKEKFSLVSSLPKNEFFNFVAKDFFNPFSYRVPFAYIHRDVNKIDFNGAWHQDPSTSVKFYFYLNDVGVENGAFKYTNLSFEISALVSESSSIAKPTLTPFK